MRTLAAKFVTGIVLSVVIMGVILFAKDIQTEAAYLYATIGNARRADKAVVGHELVMDFENENGNLHERRSMEESGSGYWWVNSGGVLTIRDGFAMTLQGEQDRFSQWRVAYGISSPQDTDNGYYPQNLFRLVSRSEWRNAEQKISFRIVKDNIHESPNRNESNGIFLMSRYVDSDTLYYLGVRVDGAAVIKRKAGGVYETLAYEKLFEGEPYHRERNPSLLPKNEWIGMRSVVWDNRDGGVRLELFIQDDSRGWIRALAVTDESREAIKKTGHVGVRTDFMDVQFDNYEIREISPN